MAKTATELYEMSEKIEHIAHSDFLETLSALMPYLRERKHLARRLIESNNVTAGHEMMQHINKEIAVLLDIF